MNLENHECLDQTATVAPRRLRERLPRSAPIVVAGAVLLLAIGGSGGAVAGSLISSKQIKDNTVTSADIKNKTITKKDLAKSVWPRRGARGPVGAQGVPGTRGPAGERGAAGPVTGELQPGVTLRGSFVLTSPTGSAAGVETTSDISFGLYPTTPGLYPATVVLPGAAKPDMCKGTVWKPIAAPGHLCVFVSAMGGYDGASIKVVSMASAEDPDSQFALTGRISPAGGYIAATTTGSTLHYVRGTWAFTAP